MGGLLSALFSSGAIGGSSAKTDRSNELTSYSDLKNIFSYGLPFGQQTAAQGQAGYKAGQGDLGTAAGYLKSLTSGGRAATAQAIAPEVASVTSANDAAKRQLATSGTARGGGVAGVNQQRDADAQAKIDEALFNVRPKAAGELAQVGQAEGSLGLGETREGLESTAIAADAATNLGKLSSANRTQSNEIHRQAVSDISGGIESTLAGIMDAFGGGG
jgi:hypothetical protein